MSTHLKPYYPYKKPNTGIWYCSVISPVTRKKICSLSTRTRNKKEAESIMNEWAVLGFPQPQTAREKSHLPVLELDLLKHFKSSASKKNIDFDTWSECFLFMLDAYKKIIPKEKAKDLIDSIANIYNLDLQTEETTEEDSPLFLDFALNFMDYDTSPYIQDQINSGILEEQITTRKSFTCKYYTIKKYISWFSEIYKDLKLKNLTAEIVNNFFAHIKSTSGMKLTTLKKEQSHFKCILKYAEKKNMMPSISNDLIKYKAKSETKEILNKDELKKLFSSFDNFSSFKYYCFHRLAVETACRMGELQGLKLNDVKEIENLKGEKEYWINIDKAWNTKESRMSTTKTKNSKVVLISKEMFEYLEKLKNENPFRDDDNSFIFFNKRLSDKPVHYKSITSDMDKMFGKLGLKRKGLTFHSYRHLSVVILNDKNYSNEQIMLLTGHASQKMVSHYANHITEEKKEIYRNMNDDIRNFINFTEKAQKGIDKNENIS